MLPGIAVLGCLLRLRQFLAGRSLWRDEAAIVTDLRELSLTDSLTGISPGNQMAPPGFWIVQHPIYEVSSTDAALRLLPLVSGCGLVVLTLRYARRALSSPIARLFVVASVSVSPSLVYYSAELKQYATEATVSMLLMVAIADRERVGRWGRAGIGVLAIAFSPAGLVLVALLGLGWLAEEMRSRGGREAIRILWAPGLALVAAAAAFARFVHRTEPPYMDGFWVDSYGPAPLDADALRWWADAFLGLVHLATSQVGFAWHLPVDGWTSGSNRALTVLVVAIVVAGAFVVGTERARLRATTGWLAATPVIGALVGVLAVLSILDLYPFRGRIILHLVPLLFVLVAHALDVIIERRIRALSVIATTAASVIVLSATWTAASDAVTPYDTYDIEPVLEWVDDRATSDDVIIVHIDSADAVEHYAGDFDFSGAQVVVLEGYFSGSAIDAAAGPGRAWVIHGFVHEGARPLVDEALTHERVDERFEREGAIAWTLLP